MKMYNKSDLSLVDGLIVADNGEVVSPSPYVIHLANKLETMAQKAKWLKAQPKAQPMPNLDEFERESIYDQTGLEFTVETPMVDIEVAKAMAIMDELDDMKTVEQANDLLKDFSALLRFVESDNVLDCGNKIDDVFDTPTLGNPLRWTTKDVTSVIAEVCGIVPDEEGEEE